MDPAKYEYQSDFARRYLAQGRSEGRAEALLRQLHLKFGSVSDTQIARVREASVDELDRWVDRVLSATSIEDTLL